MRRGRPGGFAVSARGSAVLTIVDVVLGAKVASAALSFEKVAQLAKVVGFRLVYTSTSVTSRAQLEVTGARDDAAPITFAADLDHGLQLCEDGLLDLARASASTAPPQLPLLEQELREAGDRRERVVQFVGDARDELADRGELLALDQLGFHGLLVRHVLYQHHDALIVGRARDARRVEAQRAPELAGADGPRLREVPAPRGREHVEQRPRFAE